MRNDDIEKELNSWETGNNLSVFRGYGTTKEELEAEWNEFQSKMDTEQQLKSDDESIKVFGKSNLERYKELIASAPSSSDSNEVPADEAVDLIKHNDDNEISIDLDEETLEKIQIAKQYMIDMNTTIMYPTRTIKELDELYNKMKSEVSQDKIEINDTKVVELFGYTNEEFYQYYRNKLLDYYESIDDKVSEISTEENTYIKLQNASSVNEIISAYVETANSDIIYSDEYIIDEAERKLSSLLEYTPMAALNPVIGLGRPFPMYLPGEHSVSTELISDEDLKAIKKFNSAFDDLCQGMKDDNFDDIVDEWYNFVCNKQIDYFKAKKNSSAVAKLTTELLEREILSVGWHPDYDISSITNWKELNENTLSRIEDRYYHGNKIINLCELVTLLNKDDTKQDDIKKLEKRSNMNPIYLVLVSGDKITSNIIQWWTKGPFSHSALGLNHELNNLMSFNNAEDKEHQGLSIESLDMYVPDKRLIVYSIFVTDEDYIALKKNIEYYLNNKSKTHYSKINILSLAFKKPLNFEYDMVCSQFVDRLLKFINVDISNKDSSLVSPNDLYRAATTNNKIYKLYDGKVKDYKPDKIKNAIDHLLYSKHTKYFKELASLVLETGAKLLKHRKTNIKQSYKTVYGTTASNSGVGLASDDYHKVIQQHSIELTGPIMDEYDKLLAIEDDDKFIKEFNKWIDKEIDKVLPVVDVNTQAELNAVRKRRKPVDNDESGISYALSMQTARYYLEEEAGYLSTEELKDILRDNYFIKGDNPERIRRELKFRQAYNKKILSMFNVMIKYNYDQLGISYEEAKRISDMFKGEDSDKYEAVKIIKDALDKNAKEFEVKPNVYDFRKLNLGNKPKPGVICISKNSPNEKLSLLSRMIQKSFEWDCIIYSHANTNPNIEDINQYVKELRNIADQNLRKNSIILEYLSNRSLEFVNNPYARKVADALQTLFVFELERGRIISLIEDKSDVSQNLLDKLIKESPKTVKQIESILVENVETADKLILKELYLLISGSTESSNDKQLDEVISFVNNNFILDTLIPTCQLLALNNYLCNHVDWVWTVQPTYTPEAGPFKTMNGLVRELIKEGFKKILILSCNPGSYEFPDDIKNSHVLIKYADVSTVMESDEMNKTFDNCLEDLDIAESNMRKVCLENDINYDDNDYLLECSNKLDNDLKVLYEVKNKTKKASWSDLKDVIKEVIAGLTWMFKQTIEFFKGILLKMKELINNIINNGKFIKPVKVKFIEIDKNKAKIKEHNVSSYDELEREAVKSCASITESVNNYQKANLRVYNNCAKIINQKNGIKKTNESTITEQDVIDNLFDCIPVPILEAKEFPVQFDDDGNLLIKNYHKMDYNKEYQHSHELLKTYDKSNSIEGIKYELARLWFVYTVLEADIYENKKLPEEKKKEYTKIKAWIMNDFTRYSKTVAKADPSFNFSEYYNTTPFSDVYIKIHSSTIKFLTNLLSKIF